VSSPIESLSWIMTDKGSTCSGAFCSVLRLFRTLQALILKGGGFACMFLFFLHTFWLVNVLNVLDHSQIHLLRVDGFDVF